MIDKIRKALEVSPHLYLFTGDGEPFYVLNEAGVERRKRLYAESGKVVKISKISKGDVGESLEHLLNMDGEVIENELVEKPKRNKKVKNGL